MKTLNLGGQLAGASAIALGCMRMDSLSLADSQKVLATCQNLGINFFDHADIYGKGQSESRFGQAWTGLGLARQDLLIQSKCGLADVWSNYHFDFSKAHIIQAVEGSLKRLQTDYLDVLALHRPDALMEPEEVAEAFHDLHQSGKVRSFGVSNQNPGQISLLSSYLDQALIVNQLEFGPAHTVLLDASLNVNTKDSESINRDGDVLNYCRLHQVTVQAWSPFQVDLHQGPYMLHPDYQDLRDCLASLALSYGVSSDALALAWILRHPAKMQVLVGSMQPWRLVDLAQACRIDVSREDWYRIYKAGGNRLP